MTAPDRGAERHFILASREPSTQGLQMVATAAAINLNRLAAWFAERPLAATRVSRFAALAA